MAYVSVPKDLTKVKNKVAFNLTKRQIICLGIALGFLFIDVVLCSFYAARNIRVILIKSQWRNTKKWPRGDKSQVAFITKDDCIYNGIYDKDCGVFRAYDGLKFQKDEIVSWCYDSQRDHLYRYFIKYFSNPVRRTDW